MGGSKRIFKPRQSGNIISRNWKGYKWVNGMMMTAKQARAADLRQASSTFTRNPQMETSQSKPRPSRVFSMGRSSKAKQIVTKWLADNPGWHAWDGNDGLWAALKEPLLATGYESMVAARSVIYGMSDQGEIMHAYEGETQRNVYAANGTDVGKNMTLVVSSRMRRHNEKAARRSRLPRVLVEDQRREAKVDSGGAAIRGAPSDIKIEVYLGDGRVFMRSGGMLMEISGRLTFGVGDMQIEIGVNK